MPTQETPSQPLRGGYPTEAFERLERIERDHFWFESRNRLIVWAIRQYFPNARTFLDVGCGTGFVLAAIHEAIPGLNLTAMDSLADGLTIASRRVPSATFFQRDARQLDVVDGFDLVGAFDVLEHIEEDARVLERIYAAVRPGGGALITVPQHPWLWSRSDDYGCHVRRYRRHELSGRLRDAGFEVVRTTSFISLLLPVLVVSRRFDARREGEQGPSGIWVPKPLNAFLRSVLTLERLLIRVGVSWPAGGSLLFVAWKPDGPSPPAGSPAGQPS